MSIWYGEGASSSALVNFNNATLGVGIDDNNDDVVGIIKRLKRIK